MKVIRENLFEKFEEDSDPIKDMGIGRIDFRQQFSEQYINPTNKIFQEWVDYISIFKGKVICGNFAYYAKGVFDGKMVYAEVLFDNIFVSEQGAGFDIRARNEAQEQTFKREMYDYGKNYIQITNEGVLNIKTPDGTYCMNGHTMKETFIIKDKK